LSGGAFVRGSFARGDFCLEISGNFRKFSLIVNITDNGTSVDLNETMHAMPMSTR